MTISKYTIKAYSNHLTSTNIAQSYINEHIRYANRFAEFVGRRKLCTPLLNEYRQYIDTNYTTHNSKNSCVSYVNTFLKFLGRPELVLAYFDSNRVEVKLKTPALTDEEIAALLRYADTYEKCEGCDFNGKQHY